MTISQILGCPDPENPDREKNDFYGTPPECTHALLDAEIPRWPKRRIPYMSRKTARNESIIWEPACGDGAISEVLKKRGFPVISTDLVDRGYPGAVARIDFLMEYRTMSTSVITNPPFKLAHQFVSHAHGLGVNYMAMLVKSDFFNSQRTGVLFDIWRPARIYALTWRPDFKKGGAPTMTCNWVVFDGSPVRTDYLVMNKPREKSDA